MRIEHLRECVDLADTLSFTQTSKNAYIAQPSLTKHIASVEKEVGFPIFERTKRKVMLTKLGELFIEKAKKVVDAYDELEEAVLSASNGLDSVIQIGYLRGAIGAYIPRIHALFSSAMPGVEIDYIAHEFHEIGDVLERGEVDVIVAAIPESSLSSAHCIVNLFYDTYYAAVDYRHPLAARESITPQDLAHNVVALPASGFYNTDTPPILEYLETEKNEIEVRRSVRDINSLPILVQSNDWIGITFGHLKDLYGDEITLLPLDGFDMKVPYNIIWKRGNANAAIRKWAQIASDVVSANAPIDAERNILI